MSLSDDLKKTFGEVGLSVDVKELDVEDVSITLNVKVRPASKLEQISIQQNRLIVHLREKAVDNMANEGVTEAIGEALGLPKSSVFINRGHRSKEKKIVLNYVTGPSKQSSYFCSKIRGLK